MLLVEKVFQRLKVPFSCSWAQVNDVHNVVDGFRILKVAWGLIDYQLACSNVITVR